MAKAKIRQHLINLLQLPEEQIDVLFSSFLAALAGHLQALEKSVASDDPVSIARAAHTIKGALLNLGLAEFADIALVIEKKGRAGDKTTDYAQLVSRLKKKITPIIE